MIILSIILFVILVVSIFGTKYELFNIRLEKATTFYDDYRNFIEGKHYLLTKNRKDKRLIPYVINTKCLLHSTGSTPPRSVCHAENPCPGSYR